MKNWTFWKILRLEIFLFFSFKMILKREHKHLSSGAPRLNMAESIVRKLPSLSLPLFSFSILLFLFNASGCLQASHICSLESLGDPCQKPGWDAQLKKQRISARDKPFCFHKKNCFLFNNKFCLYWNHVFSWSLEGIFNEAFETLNRFRYNQSLVIQMLASVNSKRQKEKWVNVSTSQHLIS